MAASSSSLEKVSEDLRTARIVVHNLGETFNSFQVHSCSIFNLVEQWRNLQSSFAVVHKSLESKVKELESKEREIGSVANELRNYRNAVELKHKRLVDGENSLSEKIKEVELRRNEVKDWLEVIEVEKGAIIERKKAVEAKERELVEGLERVKKVDDDEIRVKKFDVVAEELGCREKQIDERCKAVELREGRVDERFRAVELREIEVEERCKELEFRENQADNRCTELELRERENIERQEVLEVKETRLDEERRVLGFNEKRLLKDQQALELREREMDDLYSLLELRENEINERFKEVESREKELKLREEELGVQHEEFKSKEKDIIERFDVLKGKEKSINDDRRALQEKENEINERFASLVVREEEVNKQSRDVKRKEMQVNAQCIVLQEKERVLNDQWDMLELRGKEVDERSKAVMLKEKEVGELRQGVDERSKAVELKEKGVEELHRGVELKEKEMNECLQGLQLKQKQINERLKEMEVKIKEISEHYKEMEMKEKQINRRKNALELREQQFEDANKALQLKEKEVTDCYQMLEQKDKKLNDLPQLLELQDEHCKVLSEVEQSIEKQLNEVSKSSESKDKQINEPSKATECVQEQVNELSQGWELTEKKINEQFVCDHDKEFEIKQKDINDPRVTTELNGNRVNPHHETQDHSNEQKKLCSDKMEVKGKQMVDEALDLKLTQTSNLQNIPVFASEQQANMAHKSRDTQNAELNEVVGLKENQVTDTIQKYEVGKMQPQKTDSNLAVDGNGKQGGASKVQAMNGKTFQLYLNERVNEHGSMKEEIVNWLKSTSNPGKLVLEAIDGFFAPHMTKDGVAFEASVVRSSCLLLLEHLMNMKPAVSKALRKEAAMVSIKWRAKMKVQGENEVIALAFLMLLVTYNLTTMSKKDDLRRLCGMIDKHRLGPRLRQKLGLLERTSVSRVTENDTKEPIQLDSLQVTNEVSSSVKIPGDIHSLCRSMDGQGVKSYLLEHVREYNVLDDKILDALRYALDPAKLVLDVCHVSVTDSEKNRAYANTTMCIFVLKQLMKLSPSISLEVSNEAKIVADFLKARLKGSSIPADYHRFLQFIASYKLAKSYNPDELLSYIKIFYSRDEVYMPEENAHLCLALGIAKKIPGLIKSLIGQQKLLLAVKYICVFKLEHSFQVVPLLEAHLESVNNKVDEKRRTGNFKDKIDAEHLELMTLKSILTCISNFKLESKLPPNRFISRIKELEEEKERRMGRKCGRKRGLSPRPCIATPLQKEKRPRVGTVLPRQPVSPVPYPSGPSRRHQSFGPTDFVRPTSDKPKSSWY